MDTVAEQARPVTPEAPKSPETRERAVNALNNGVNTLRYFANGIRERFARGETSRLTPQENRIYEGRISVERDLRKLAEANGKTSSGVAVDFGSFTFSEDVLSDSGTVEQVQNGIRVDTILEAMNLQAAEMQKLSDEHRRGALPLSKKLSEQFANALSGDIKRVVAERQVILDNSVSLSDFIQGNFSAASKEAVEGEIRIFYPKSDGASDSMSHPTNAALENETVNAAVVGDNGNSVNESLVSASNVQHSEGAQPAPISWENGTATDGSQAVSSNGQAEGVVSSGEEQAPADVIQVAEPVASQSGEGNQSTPAQESVTSDGGLALEENSQAAQVAEAAVVAPAPESSVTPASTQSPDSYTFPTQSTQVAQSTVTPVQNQGNGAYQTQRYRPWPTQVTKVNNPGNSMPEPAPSANNGQTDRNWRGVAGAIGGAAVIATAALTGSGDGQPAAQIGQTVKELINPFMIAEPNGMPSVQNPGYVDTRINDNPPNFATMPMDTGLNKPGPGNRPEMSVAQETNTIGQNMAMPDSMPPPSGTAPQPSVQTQTVANPSPDAVPPPPAPAPSGSPLFR